MRRYDVVVIGSGFAGSILARLLRRQGLEVGLLERGSHPRFALGESSTPLAAICLERLASRNDMPDLGWLAAYGRWLNHLPNLRRGLKRGFTFYQQVAGEAFVNSERNERRLLVAASPEDAVADSHWLREDVDSYLVERAVAEGIDYRARTDLSEIEPSRDGWHLQGDSPDGPFEASAATVVDGSGAGGFLASHLGLEQELERTDIDTQLIYGHFRGVEPLASAVSDSASRLAAGPYPDERAAVHHLLDEGWLYVLPFDHGVVSAGVLLDRRRAAAGEDLCAGSPEMAWQGILGRYPTLATQFASADPVAGIRRLQRVQRWLSRGAGDGWVLLPHAYAFFDPMYSTGIAWSLLGVERIAALFAEQGTNRPDFSRYGALLEREALQINRLLEGAWLAMGDFRRFTAQSFLYFAIVSFSEVEQRLWPAGRAGTEPAWQGFLGAGDLEIEALFNRALERLGQPQAAGPNGGGEPFEQWVERSISRWNLVGLANPERQNLYPVDLDVLVDRSRLLDVERDFLVANLHRLRGR